MGPAGPDGISLEEYVHKNGSVKMDVYTKSSTGTDSLILSTEYLHEDDRTDSHYSEGDFPGFSIFRINLKNLTSISIRSEKSPSEPMENQVIYLNYDLNDTLGNGKLISTSASLSTYEETLEISDYSFDKATGIIRFTFKSTYNNSDPNKMALIVKGSAEVTLNEEVYLRRGIINE